MNGQVEGVPLGVASRPWLRLPALRRWNLDRAQTAILAGVLLLTLLVYLRCLGNGFVYDDRSEILENRYLAQWSFLWKSMIRDVWWFRHPHRLPQSAYYRPLQNIWLAINFHLFGLHPAGWHLLKILLHLCAVVLSFRVAQLLTRSVAAALLTALLFGLLPVHTEAVAWSVGPPQAAVLELAALSLFIQRSRTHWHGVVWPVLVFACAALSHESAVVFPLLIALYVFLFESPVGESVGSASPGESAPLPRRIGNALAWSAPFLCVALLYMGARLLVLGTNGLLGFVPGAVVMHGSRAIKIRGIKYSFGQILMTLPTVLLHYLELLIVPWFAGPEHDVKFVTTPGLTSFYVPAAVLGMLALVGYLAFGNRTRGKLYLFCAAWWLITLAPVLNFNSFQREADLVYIHDRFEYLPSLAFCLLLADCAVRFASTSAVRRRAATAVLTALTILYAGTLWRAEHFWHDNLTLFTRSVEEAPDSPSCRSMLALALLRQGNSEAAVQLLLNKSHH
jgi:hypothetical protein